MQALGEIRRFWGRINQSSKLDTNCLDDRRTVLATDDPASHDSDPARSLCHVRVYFLAATCVRVGTEYSIWK